MQRCYVGQSMTKNDDLRGINPLSVFLNILRKRKEEKTFFRALTGFLEIIIVCQSVKPRKMNFAFAASQMNKNPLNTIHKIYLHNLKIGARSSSFACERVQNGYLFDMLCT